MKSKSILSAAFLLSVALGGLALTTHAEDKKSSLNSSDTTFVKETG